MTCYAPLCPNVLDCFRTHVVIEVSRDAIYFSDAKEKWFTVDKVAGFPIRTPVELRPHEEKGTWLHEYPVYQIELICIRLEHG